MSQKTNGFTLIELLIVILIISITAGIAAVTVSTNQRKQYEVMAAQLTNIFLLAEQEAMLRSASLGFVLKEHSFQFYIFQRSKKPGNSYEWQALTQTPLALHAIPKDMQLTLKINAETVPTDGQPHVIISPSNDLTPFVIFIGKKHETPYYQVTGKANGEVTHAVITAE
jgi:general secretion pathway protein H